MSVGLDTSTTNDNKKEVIIYTSDTCHYCHEAKHFFEENNIEYTEKNASQNPDYARELVEKTEQMAVPVIYVGEQMILGFNQNALKQALGL
jgi:glutaredoxin-like YruB-family protein